MGRDTHGRASLGQASVQGVDRGAMLRRHGQMQGIACAKAQPMLIG